MKVRRPANYETRKFDEGVKDSFLRKPQNSLKVWRVAKYEIRKIRNTKYENYMKVWRAADKYKNEKSMNIWRSANYKFNVCLDKV